MCFSAGASFTAAAILSAAGAITLKKTSAPEQRLFASIPLVFGIQQLGEGFLWQALHHGSETQERFATFFFLVIAQVVWPLLVPLSIFFLEKESRRKRFLSVFVAMGAVSSLYLGWCIAMYPVQAVVESHHIRYDLGFPHLKIPFAQVFYLVATVASTFVSGTPRMKILGLQILVALIVTKLFYTSYFVSVWCFFAALLSVEIYMIIRKLAGPRQNLAAATK